MSEERACQASRGLAKARTKRSRIRSYQRYCCHMCHTRGLDEVGVTSAHDLVATAGLCTKASGPCRQPLAGGRDCVSWWSIPSWRRPSLTVRSSVFRGMPSERKALIVKVTVTVAPLATRGATATFTTSRTRSGDLVGAYDHACCVSSWLVLVLVGGVRAARSWGSFSACGIGRAATWRIARRVTIDQLFDGGGAHEPGAGLELDLRWVDGRGEAAHGVGGVPGGA